MSYNLITFSNYFHWVHTINGCPNKAAIYSICCDVANYTRKRRNVINFKKNLSENLSS